MPCDIFSRCYRWILRQRLEGMLPINIAGSLPGVRREMLSRLGFPRDTYYPVTGTKVEKGLLRSTSRHPLIYLSRHEVGRWFKGTAS